MAGEGGMARGVCMAGCVHKSLIWWMKPLILISVQRSGPTIQIFFIKMFLTYWKNSSINNSFCRKQINLTILTVKLNRR